MKISSVVLEEMSFEFFLNGCHGHPSFHEIFIKLHICNQYIVFNNPI